MIFEVKCDERRTNERTYGPDAHMYCLFYSIRYSRFFWSLAKGQIFRLGQFSYKCKLCKGHHAGMGNGLYEYKVCESFLEINVTCHKSKDQR